MDKEILILGKEAFDKLKPDVQRFIKQQSQCIADLEAKLAESEKKVDEFHDKLLDEIQNKVDREVELTNCLNNVVDERDQLKQQLAEKEKESLKYFNEYRAWKEKCELLEQDQNQTAIAELEKVVEFIKEYPHEPRYWDIASYIDQQIKELKGDK